MEEIREYVKTLSLPERDVFELPISGKTFPDGAHYRCESVPESYEDVEYLFSVADKYDIVIHKITECEGIMLNTDEEILRMCELCRDHGAELCLTAGPRAPYDIGIDGTTPATNIALRIRGMDQLVFAIADMIRAAELGVRYFRITDEGLLVVASEMRKRGLLPPQTKFKISADVGIANPSSLRYWTNSGLLNDNDTINIARDLTFPMIAAMRAVTNQPLDIHVHHKYCPPATIMRTLDAPEILRLASPVYFKSSIPTASHKERTFTVIKSLQQTIEKYYPEARMSKPRAKGIAVPAKPGWKPKW